jgi:hypothetical protein
MAFPVDIKFINEAERKLGVKFPATFIVRMAKNNGGQVNAMGDQWELHPFFDISDRTRVKRTCNDIVRETNEARQWRGFPEQAIAIGSNGTGDSLVLVPSPDAPGILGPVYFWDHETGELSLVADDFGDLT